MAPKTATSFFRDVYYESFVTLMFSVAMTSLYGASHLLKDYFPTAQKEQLIGALLVGWLTFFGVFFGSAVVNPAVGLMLVAQRSLSIGKYLLYTFLQILLTLLGVLIVAATYESYPALFKGVPAPAPPPAHESPNHVLLSEFAVTFSVLFAGGLLSRAAGRVPGAFLGSLFYWVVAYAEAGAYSGAIMNPASILALHVYKEVDKPKAWAEAAPRVAPYAAGAAAAALLLGLYNRGRAAGAGGGAGGAGGARPAMSKAAAERRQRAMKAE